MCCGSRQAGRGAMSPTPGRCPAAGCDAWVVDRCRVWPPRCHGISRERSGGDGTLLTCPAASDPCHSTHPPAASESPLHSRGSAPVWASLRPCRSRSRAEGQAVSGGLLALAGLFMLRSNSATSCLTLLCGQREKTWLLGSHSAADTRGNLQASIPLQCNGFLPVPQRHRQNGDSAFFGPGGFSPGEGDLSL
jgi:hypothetical protein